MTHIDTISLKSPIAIQIRELTRSANRIKQKKFLLEGVQAIEWAIKHGVRIEGVVHDIKHGEYELITTLRNLQVPICASSSGLLRKITNRRYDQGIVGIGSLPNVAMDISGEEMVVVMDGVVDHGNIGTIIRTARGFGINNILSTHADMDIFHKKSIDASRGKVFDIVLQRFNDPGQTIQYLQENDYQIVATSSYGSRIQSTLSLERKPVALVIGNESEGISKSIMERADHIIQIPMLGDVESLNVGVAAGIHIYELKFKLVITMLKKFIHNTLGRELNVTSQMVQAHFDQKISAVSSISGAQLIFLMVLECDQIMTHEHILRDMGLTQAELGTFLLPLLEKGYVSSEEHNSVCMTGAGREFIGKMWSVVEETEEEILQGFSQVEKDEMRDFIRRIQSNCQL